jgi:DNA-binding NtrC family response regulator
VAASKTAVMPGEVRAGLAIAPSPEANLLNLVVVDDEREIRECCRDIARALGFGTYTAATAAEAYRIMDGNTIDVVLVDLRLPGEGGLEMLREIKARRPESVIVVMTGHATVESAVDAMKLGAYDYLSKPFGLDELRLLLERAAAHVHLATENRVLRQKIRAREGFAGLVGRAPEMEKLYRIIAKVASSSHPVLIQGESGTGKELVARAIHFSGPYRDKPFLPVDCGSLVPTLIESELFGYVRGAFTGAAHAKDGLLSIAAGGTVFLDEVGELTTDLQAKLLRAIQEKEIRPVGSTRTISIDVRILAATNRNLEEAVANGSFRKDLYYRLNVVNLRIPPLRERKGDIPLLIFHFLERLRRHGGAEHTLSDSALRLIMAYDWPGNVRELENCLERAAALSSATVLHVPDLPTTLQNSAHVAETVAGKAGDGIVSMAELEKQAILNTIRQLHGDKLAAARALGIGKTTLYRKLKEYGIAL